MISNLRPEYVSKYTLALWGASGKCSGPPVINVISNYSSLNVISSYSSLNNFEEGRESKISSAKVNKIRESKIFLYDISMVKYDLSYVIHDNLYHLFVHQSIDIRQGKVFRYHQIPISSSEFIKTLIIITCLLIKA